MSKLLRGRLPTVIGNQAVDSDTFNSTVRLLELSLNAFDPDATPQFTRTQRDELKFNAGDVIWNSTINTLQVYSGNEWISLSKELPYETSSLEAVAEVGAVQVITNGAIVVNVHG